MNTPTPAPAAAPLVRPATVGELAALFLDHMARRVADGRSAARTLGYYRSGLARWAAAVGAGLPLAEVIPYHVERHCRTFHATQCVKRAFAWAAAAGLPAASRADVWEARRPTFLARWPGMAPEDLNRPLELLAEHRYLEAAQPSEDRRGPGRRPTDRYLVNPLWDRNEQSEQSD
jgi:hypothetical protein